MTKQTQIAGDFSKNIQAKTLHVENNNFYVESRQRELLSRSLSPDRYSKELEMGKVYRDIAVLAAFAVLDPDDHAAAVDVANLEGGHLAHPQARAIS